MKECESLELLDKFLAKFLKLRNNNYRASIGVFTEWNLKEITIAEIQMILGKLIRDGYVLKYQLSDSQPNALLADNYVLTFEGKVFIENGGCSTAYEMDRRKMKIQNRKDWLVIVGTWGASIAAILLFCV